MSKSSTRDLYYKAGKEYEQDHIIEKECFGGNMSLAAWCLKMRDKHNIKTIIETGTNLAKTTEFFVKAFEKVYTIDIQEEYTRLAKEKFADRNNVQCVCGDSSVLLESICKKIPQDETVLLFLDAHGNYEKDLVKMDLKKLKDVESMDYFPADSLEFCPILKELETVSENLHGRCLIIVDDVPSPYRNDFVMFGKIIIDHDNFNKVIARCFSGKYKVGYLSKKVGGKHKGSLTAEPTEVDSNHVVFINANLEFDRLPNKHLLKIDNKCCIEHLIERVKKSKRADKIVLCTTLLEQDTILCDIAKRHGIDFFRSGVKDKLVYWKGATEKFDVDFFVAVDSADLFYEPKLIDLAFEQYDSGKADFIALDRSSFIYGAFSYGIKTMALHFMCEEKRGNEAIRELFDKGCFKKENLQNVSEILMRPELRMTLGYEEDFTFFKQIYAHMKGKDFTLEDVILLINDHPEISKINQFRHLDWKRERAEKMKKTKETSEKYRGNELNYLTKVLNSESWSSTEGSWTNTLESKFAEKFDAKYAVAMNSGTSVLHAALIAAGVRPGDEVITPAITVFMDTSSIIHCNAIPVYADVQTHTFNIDPADVVKKITPKTKAIIAVSLYGLECDIAALMTIAEQHDLCLIVDNAQHMGKHKAHITTYSFENSKHISCGEGGIVITNNEQMAGCMRKLSNHGFKNSTAIEGRTKLNADEFQSPHYKRHSVIGWNYRLSEFCAAVALAQLERVDELVASRFKAAKAYWDVISAEYGTNISMYGSDPYKNGPNPIVLPQKSEIGHTYWTFAVRLNGINVQRFRKLFLENGGDGFYGAWSLPYMEPAMTSRMFVKLNPEVYKNVQYDLGLCKKAEHIRPSIIQFKTNYRNEEDIIKQSEALKNTLRKL
jgi:perosamine synthetase